MTTGQTPAEFGKGMLEKAKSVTVDPVLTIYGPGGMLDKAAQKAVDKMMGIDRPDEYYVTPEEHDKQLHAIIAVGSLLLPPIKLPGGGAAGPTLVTPERVVMQAPAVAGTGVTVSGSVVAGGVALTTGGGSGGQNPIPPKPKEPGEWTNDLTAGQNMTAEQAKYQKQVTGQQPSKTYHVKGRSFDAYEPGSRGKPGTLVEAKHLDDEGRFAKAYENMNKGNFSDFQHLMDRAENILEQARAQVNVAKGTGARIEWRVSGKKGEQALKQLFENDATLKGKIDVIYIPLK